jgi:hypothetical protein
MTNVVSKKFVAPALPTAPPDYDQRREDQHSYALRLYFNLLDRFLSDVENLLNNGGPFPAIDVGTLTADDVESFTLYSTYGEHDNFRSVSNQLSNIINRQFVGGTVMASQTYGGMFYGDGRYISTPYNQFESRVDQTAPDVATANALELEVTDFQDTISITGANDTRITFSEAGIYFISYSLQFVNTTNDGQSIDIWIRYNGSDYANSNTRFHIPPRKSTGDPSYLVAVTTIAGDALNDNDYVEIMWRVSDTGVSLEYLPAVTASPGVTPAIPATPSAIVQASFISAQFPPVQRIAPASAVGFTELGRVIVSTNQT